MIASILLLLLAVIVLITMILTDRTILYADLYKENWIFAPTREQNPRMFWTFIIIEVSLISYLVLDFKYGFAGFWD